jgi:outer membrane protein TolC
MFKNGGTAYLKMYHNPRGGWTLAVLKLTLAAVCVPASAQVSLTTVVDLAQRNSDQVKLAQAGVGKAEAALAESRDVLVPSLLVSTGLPVFPEVGFTGTPPSIWNARIESLVFSVSQRHYVEAARFGLQAASSNLKDAREQVALDASIAYIELDTVDQELDAARHQEESSSRLVQIEQQRAEAGVDVLSELLQARLTAAQIKLRRLHLQTRAETLARQLATLTGLPEGSITPDHASIPEVPQVRAGDAPHTTAGIGSAQMLARSKQQVAKGDEQINNLPQLSFAAQYNRDTGLLNNVNSYFAKPLPADNFLSGISIQIPIFDLGHRAKGRESAAEALRATVEAEQAQRQNEIQIAALTGTLRELDALEEIASLKQQLADEQLKTVLAQLELGNGQSGQPGAPQQLSPKAEELARIDERQKYEEALEAGLDLAKTRLSLLRALGHMEDWLHELHGK